MTSAWRIPEHVRAVTSPGGGGVVLDQRTGRCYAMNGVAMRLWLAWERTGDLPGAPDSVVAHRPARATGGLSSESQALAEALLSRGLLVQADGARAGAESPKRTAMRPVAPCSSRSLRLCSVIVFPAVLLLIRLPFRVTVAVMRWLHGRWCNRMADASQARTALREFDLATRLHPGRVACLERSLGAVLAMALTRRRLSLVIGVADDPCRFHAWVDPGDRPVNHPPDADLSVFRPITVL